MQEIIIEEQVLKWYNHQIEQHAHDFHTCAAHSEGLACCLDKDHLRSQTLIRGFVDFMKVALSEQAKKLGRVEVEVMPEEIEINGVTYITTCKK